MIAASPALSQRPEVRAAERAVLIYSPIWMAIIGALALTGWFASWGDPGHLALGICLSLPLYALPALYPASRTYLGRALIFLSLTSLIQNYFGARLFFVGLGMQYHFPVRWIWNGTPVFLYLVTVAYFATYYVVLGIAARLLPRGRARPLLLTALCYGVAFAETFFMASEALSPYFSYADKTYALGVGSLCYGTLFYITLPVFTEIEEHLDRPLAPLFWKTLGANMLSLMFYEMYLSVLLIRHL